MRLIPSLNGADGSGPARRIAAVIAVAAIVLAAGAIGTWIVGVATDRPSASDEHAGHDDEGGGVDTTDARQVAATVLTTMYSWNPASDASPADAARRALPHLTGTARTQVQQSSGPVRPIASWQQWAKDRTLITAAIDPGEITDLPADRSDSGAATVRLRVPVLQLVQPVDGPATRYTKITVRVTATQLQEKHWAVSEFTLTDFN